MSLHSYCNRRPEDTQGPDRHVMSGERRVDEREEKGKGRIEGREQISTEFAEERRVSKEDKGDKEVLICI